MGLRITDNHAGVSLAILDGELSIYGAAALKTEIEGLAADHDLLEIDLSRVTDIDTAGLQWMLMAKRLPGLSVRFVNHSPAVLGWLELSNLARAVGDPLVLLAAGRKSCTEEAP